MRKKNHRPSSVQEKILVLRFFIRILYKIYKNSKIYST